MTTTRDLPEKHSIRLACPKCKSRDLILHEEWTAYIDWTTTDGILDKFYDTDENPEGYCRTGEPVKVRAICQKCSYEWVARGVSQITELIQ